MKFTIHAPFGQPFVAQVRGDLDAPLTRLLPPDASVRACLVNGEVVADWRACTPKGRDEIDVYLEPGDPATGAALAAAISAFAASAVGAFLIKAAVLIAISLAIQALTPKPRAGGQSLGGSAGRREEAFGIAGLTNTVVAGTPKFVVYGTRKVYGHLVGTNIAVSSDGKNMSFSALYFMGDTGGDGYESIANVEINGTPAADIPGLAIETRLGTLGQSVIDGFEEVTQAYSDGRELPLNTRIVYTLKSSTARRATIIVAYANLRKINDKGDDRPGRSTIKVEFKRPTDGLWTLVGTFDFRQLSLGKLFKEIPVDFGANDEWQLGVTEVHDKGSTDPPTISPDAQLFNVVEIEESTLAYGGNALLAVRGAGSEQIQSLQGMETSAIVQGKKVKVWNGTTHDLQWTNQRLWIVRDMLTHPLVGLGHRIDEAFFNDDAALVEQAYLDEMVPGHRGDEVRDQCDLLMNDLRPGWDWLKDVLGDAGGIMIPSGTQFKPVLDRPRTPGLLWSMPGNIVEGSMKRELGINEKSINAVRGEFPDQRKDYTNNVLELQDANIGSSPTKVASYTFLSLVRESNVQRRLQYELKRRVLVSTRWQWTATQAAQISEPLDVDRLSYKTFRAKRGWSGFVKHLGTSTELYLDDLVVLDAGKTYEVIVVNARNQTQTVLVTTGPGTWGKVEVSPAFAPALKLGDIWSLGQQGIQIETVLIESVRPGSDGTVELTAAQYQSAVYTDDPLPSETDRRFFRQVSVPPLPLADATVREVALLNSDGSYAAKLKFDVTPGLVRWGGTVQAATATTVRLDGTFPSTDDYFNGAILTIGGVEQVINDYDGLTREATVPAAWSPIPTARGETMLSHGAWTIEDVDSALAANPATNAIDGDTGTSWATPGAVAGGTVARQGAVLFGTSDGSGNVSFTVPSGTTALIIGVTGNASAVVWDAGGTAQACVLIQGDAFFSAWKLVNPTSGTLTLNTGVATNYVAMWCLAGVDLTDMVEVLLFESQLSGSSTSKTATYQAGEFGIVMVQTTTNDGLTESGAVTLAHTSLTQHGGDFASGITQELSGGFTSIDSTPYTAIHLRIKPTPAVAAVPHPHHLTIDLGSSAALVKLAVGTVAGKRIRGGQILVAADNGGVPDTFHEVFAGIFPDAATQTIVIPETTGRFVRLVSLDTWSDGPEVAIGNIDLCAAGTTPDPATYEVNFQKFEATGGFVVEASDDGQDPWAFLGEAVGTTHELQAALGGVQYFRFTPTSIFSSKNFRGRFIRPVLLVGDTSAPAVPTSVAATGSTNSVILTFVPSTAEDMAATEVWRSEFNDSATARMIGEATRGALNYTDGNLPAPKLWYYWLKSRDTSGNASAFSAGVSATTTTQAGDTVPPAVPTGLTLTPSGTVANDGTFSAQLVVSWDANTEPDIQGYQVEYRINGQTNTHLSFARANSAVLFSLLPNTSYDVRVQAVDTNNNESGFTAYSTQATTTNPGAPATPTGLTAVAFPISIGLSWNLNAEKDVIAYDLERADNAGFTTNVVTLTRSLSLSYLDQVGGGVQKWYRISAVRRSGVVSNASSVVTTTSGQAGAQDIAALAIGSTHIGLAAITTAKIGDLQVGTLQVADHAITNNVANQVAGPTTISSTSYVTIASANITTSGEAVWFRAGAAVQTDDSITIALFRGSTQLGTETEYVDDGQGLSEKKKYTEFIYDTPASGTYTYSLQAKRVNVTGANGQLSNTFVLVTEVLK